jgi:kynurenine formamidase
MRPSPKNSRVIDLSWTIGEATPVFPGDPKIATAVHSTVDKEGHAIKTWSSGMHVGTHLDAPAHFLGQGGDVAGIDPARCVGDAAVLNVAPQNGVITTADLRRAWKRSAKKDTILLIHTGWSNRRNEPAYFADFPGFEGDFGAFVEETGLFLLGVDMPSVRFADGDYAGFHRMLLTKDIVIVENLVRLDELPRRVWFSALPLKLEGFDGSMVRAVAIVKASSARGAVDNTSN